MQKYNFVGNKKVNEGLDFKFYGGISREVLNNYLSRAMVYTVYKNNGRGLEIRNGWLRVILNTGTKYVARFMGSWLPSEKEEALFGHIEQLIKEAHAIDPEIIFEACIFETTYEGLNTIKIPEHVFKAFGLEPEDRCFDFKRMLYTEKVVFYNHEISDPDRWGKGIAIPDITKLETQMYFYHRATKFIDLGIEAIHLGQAQIMGGVDKNLECWTKVLKMTREYAKTHARRGAVFTNGHNPCQNFVGSDGVLLVDHNAFPTRVHTFEGQVSHLATEDNPQEVIIEVGNNDSLYLNSKGGITPSGWKCDSLPYLVEFDNSIGVVPGREGDATMPVWGYDEISWLANQPDWYRRKMLVELYEKVKAFGDDGHLEMPGHRTAYISKEGRQLNYFVDSKEFNPDGFDDEDTVIEIWQKDLLSRK